MTHPRVMMCNEFTCRLISVYVEPSANTSRLKKERSSSLSYSYGDTTVSPRVYLQHLIKHEGQPARLSPSAAMRLK